MESIVQHLVNLTNKINYIFSIYSQANSLSVKQKERHAIIKRQIYTKDNTSDSEMTLLHLTTLMKEFKQAHRCPKQLPPQVPLPIHPNHPLCSL